MPPPKKRAETGSWDRKKNAIMREYRKQQKGRPGKVFIPRQNEQSNNETKTFFQRAMQVYEAKKAIKDEKKKIREAKQREKEEAIRKYRKKKLENFKKLSEKTKWGQPVMRGRMEILLEKIQKSVSYDAIK